MVMIAICSLYSALHSVHMAFDLGRNNVINSRRYNRRHDKQPSNNDLHLKVAYKSQ